MNHELLELLQQHPDAPIYPFTYYEVVCDDWGYWQGKIEKVYYGKFWKYNDRIYFKYDDLIDAAYDEGFEIVGNPEKHEGIIIKIGL
jgi:Txe/YoeB family toxin of Txe-Axe toxin-antitoxin module